MFDLGVISFQWWSLPCVKVLLFLLFLLAWHRGSNYLANRFGSVLLLTAPLALHIICQGVYLRVLLLNNLQWLSRIDLLTVANYRLTHFNQNLLILAVIVEIIVVIKVIRSRLPRVFHGLGDQILVVRIADLLLAVLAHVSWTVKILF